MVPGHIGNQSRIKRFIIRTPTQPPGHSSMNFYQCFVKLPNCYRFFESFWMSSHKGIKVFLIPIPCSYFHLTGWRSWADCFSTNTRNPLNFLLWLVPSYHVIPWRFLKKGELNSTMDSVLPLHPVAPGSILGVAEIYWAFLSQWTMAFEWNHLVQSRGPQIQLGCTTS